MDDKRTNKKAEKKPIKGDKIIYWGLSKIIGTLASGAFLAIGLVHKQRNSFKKRIYKKALDVIHQADRNRLVKRKENAEDEREYLEQALSNTEDKLKGLKEEKEECLGGDQDLSNIHLSKDRFKELNRVEKALREDQEETTWKFFPSDIMELEERESKGKLFDKAIDGPVQKLITASGEEGWKPNRHLLVDALLKRKKLLVQELEKLQKADAQKEKPLTNPQIALAIHFIEEGGEYEMKKSPDGAKKAMEDFNLAPDTDRPKNAVYQAYTAISKDNEKDPLRESVAKDNLEAIRDFFEKNFPAWEGAIKKIDEQLGEYYRQKGEDKQSSTKKNN